VTAVGAAPRAIVVGTSVGGVEALSTVLPGLGSGLQAAVFVVIHVPRQKPSLLSGIFSRLTRWRVKEAEDKEPVQPQTIYFAPPDYHLLLERGPALALSVDDPVQFCRPSIDVLFQSAADVYGSGLLGIVLTGNNDDGAEGLAAVRAGGGRCIVQQPHGARGPTMPESALRRVPGAEVATLEEIATMLQRLSWTKEA
jgi:two-component system, chemotaxis family, protein-glutamate methylesterase/glutaminase